MTCGKSSEFDAVHGLLNRVMQVLGVPHTGALKLRGGVWLVWGLLCVMCVGVGREGEGKEKNTRWCWSH